MRAIRNWQTRRNLSNAFMLEEAWRVRTRQVSFWPGVIHPGALCSLPACGRNWILSTWVTWPLPRFGQLHLRAARNSSHAAPQYAAWRDSSDSSRSRLRSARPREPGSWMPNLQVGESHACGWSGETAAPNCNDPPIGLELPAGGPKIQGLLGQILQKFCCMWPKTVRILVRL